MSWWGHSNRKLASGAAAVIMVLSSLALLGGAAPASAAGPAPTPGQISHLQQVANELAAQLNVDQNKIQAAAEAYDEASIVLGPDRAEAAPDASCPRRSPQEPRRGDREPPQRRRRRLRE